MTYPICPYCGQPSVPATGAEIYPHRPDLALKHFFLCRPCGAYVGTHRQDGKPLGTLANATLRRWRNQTHAVFDPLWMEPGVFKGDRRRRRFLAYQLLAFKLGISMDDCHIALFDEARCRQAIDLINSREIHRSR